MNLPTRTWLLRRYGISNDGGLVYKGTSTPAAVERYLTTGEGVETRGDYLAKRRKTAA